MSRVPDADVLITNPEHLAIALRYDRERMSAPVVLAKGADTWAQEMRSIASPPPDSTVREPQTRATAVPSCADRSADSIGVVSRRRAPVRGDPQARARGSSLRGAAMIAALRRFFGDQAELVLVTILAGILLVLFTPIPARRARFPADHELLVRAAGPAADVLHGAAAGLLDVSFAAAGRDAVPTQSQRLGDAPDPRGTAMPAR